MDSQTEDQQQQPESQQQSQPQLEDSNQQQQHQPELAPPGTDLGKEDTAKSVEVPNADSGSAGDQNNAAGLPGLNPAAAAAVAALAQLTQLAGTMSAAERAVLELGLQQQLAAITGGYGGQMTGPMPFPVERSSYRGGGRRGRGRGRGRGQGRGGPRHYHPSQGAPSIQESSAIDVVGPTEERAEPSAAKHENEALAEVPKQTLSPANVAPTRVGWCELCRVQCTSLEILEQQHKNGKRHKKNLLKMGDSSCATFNPFTEVQNENKSIADENAHEGEDKANVPTEAATDENMATNDQVRRGMKRKMRGGRVGKWVKSFDGPNQPNELQKPKVVIPLICDLCNVKCDTKEVFDRHLAGKKHISKVKRYEGHHAMYGPMGLQALYPPNPISQTLFNPQGTQQVYGPQGPYPPPGAYVDPQAYYAAPAATDMGAGSGYQQYPDPQASNATPNLGAQN
ncbi:hypothetical protein LguiB_034522 [Lonicera macranthoides]